MRIDSTIGMRSVDTLRMLEGVAPTLQHPQPARHRNAYPDVTRSSPQTGQVPGFGSSVLGDAPTGTRGKVTYRVYGTVPVLMT